MINPDISNEETKLQMNICTLVVKILIIAFNEGGQYQHRFNLNTHFLTFHSLMRSCPEIIGLMDLIEENAPSKAMRFHRLLRDLFNKDP